MFSHGEWVIFIPEISSYNITNLVYCTGLDEVTFPLNFKYQAVTRTFTTWRYIFQKGIDNLSVYLDFITGLM